MRSRTVYIPFNGKSDTFHSGKSGPEGDKYPVSHIHLVDEDRVTQFTLMRVVDKFMSGHNSHIFLFRYCSNGIYPTTTDFVKVGGHSSVGLSDFVEG